MPVSQQTIFASEVARDRLHAAEAWLLGLPPGTEVLVLGDTLVGSYDLLLSAATAAGSTMGWRRTTLDILVGELALDALWADGRVPASGAARDAIVARALRGLSPEELGRFAPVTDTPGFVRSVGRSLEELRLSGIPPREIAERDAELGVLADAAAREWDAAGLADRASALEAAIATIREPESGSAGRSGAEVFPGGPSGGEAILGLDLEVRTSLEADLVAALVERARFARLTVPRGDRRTLELLAAAGVGPAGLEPEAEAGPRALDRLQRHLFVAPPEPGEGDDSVTVFSAPGEGRECVEIARRLVTLAAAGTPFDRCAVLLRQPEDYRPHLEEALTRADIPAYFARGVRRPDPAGRAFLALLRCRAEDFSALRFAEFLSIGEVPDATVEGTPPPAADEEERWADPSAEDAGPLTETGSPQLELAPRRGPEPGRGDPEAVPARPLRVPRRWEKLLVESAVVGGLERWERRLRGLAAELELRRSGLEIEDPDDPRIAPIDRDLGDLGAFRDYALPLLSDLAALPAAATWSEWLDALSALATRGLRRPENVLRVLSGLGPMGPLGPVDLDEVVRVLSPRLLEVVPRPPSHRYGRVFVGPIDAARGLAFDVVFVPGMAERVFPPKIAEDPILLDHVRESLNGGGPRRLVTNRDRVARERLALTLAAGAAVDRLVLSYPRIEAVKARPRVPSFYALEAVRAAEGRLPRFEELAAVAERVSDARIGWPAPTSPEQAIDEAEYDLAILDELGLRGDEAVKAAGHLLNSNPHLKRALRFRAYRWEVPRWTWADGLVDLSADAQAALAGQSPDARAFSATALQHFAACPYRFYLQAIQRLRPREAPVGIETLDPLQRGSLVHQAQFELLTRLQSEATDAAPLLPVTPENLEVALATLDEVLGAVAREYKDRLVPAIDRVWEDGIASIRQDLREWLHRESLERTPFVPWRFELSFGLPPDPGRDEHSVSDAADLGIGIRLRGAIDVVERTADGVLRVTDHKTGRYRAKGGAVIQGGEILQPVLYGLAARALFRDDRVASGRLYYCTTDGEYRSHEVPLDDETIGAAEILSEVVRGAFESGRFPALPRPRACEWCDYRPVCGPDEERRTKRKPLAVDLKRLRDCR